MIDVEEALSRLPERHQAALRWFAEHAGQELPWPTSLTDGTLLASKAKGIYKPSWTRYALSVRESLQGHTQIVILSFAWMERGHMTTTRRTLTQTSGTRSTRMWGWSSA